MLNKIDYSLAPIEFDDVILVLQHSAETGKYGKNDWLEGKNFDTEKSISSIKRHLTDYRKGIREDADNNLHPMLMVACRALMQYTLDKRKGKRLETNRKYGVCDVVDRPSIYKATVNQNGVNFTQENNK